MNKKYAVRLGEEERAYANEVLNGSETASSYRKRANVLLLADESIGKPMRQAEIAARCGISDVTVYHTVITAKKESSKHSVMPSERTRLGQQS